MATQELLRLAEANPGGLASLDAVNDLQLKNIDVVQASMRVRVLQDSLKQFNCIHSPTFPEQVGAFCLTTVVTEAKKAFSSASFYVSIICLLVSL